MGLRDIGETLPPGFRFFPNDEELICHYLHKKISNEETLKGTLIDIDLHTCEPWQLPQVAKLNNSEWYFFSFRDRKYATGLRTNRATACGYWKATGKDRVILDPNTKKIAGMRKTLVFYRNRAPNGIKSGWIMHEFRLENPHFPPQEDWVLCRVFYKGKSEEDDNNNNNKCLYMLDHSTTTISTISYPPPLFTSSCSSSLSSNPSFSKNKPINTNTPINDIMDILIDQNYNGQTNPNNNSTNNLSLNSNYSFLQILKDTNGDNGFLWDMELEENGISKDKLDDVVFY